MSAVGAWLRGAAAPAPNPTRRLTLDAPTLKGLKAARDEAFEAYWKAREAGQKDPESKKELLAIAARYLEFADGVQELAWNELMAGDEALAVPASRRRAHRQAQALEALENAQSKLSKVLAQDHIQTANLQGQLLLVHLWLQTWLKDRPSKQVDLVKDEGYLRELQGFRVLFEPEVLVLAPHAHEAVRAALELLRQRLLEGAPGLLSRAPPIRIAIEDPTGTARGRYLGATGVVILFLQAFVPKLRPKDLAKTFAHEFGHHYWKRTLGETARQAWEGFRRRALTILDTEVVLAAWRPEETLWDLAVRLRQEDPSLAVSLEALERGYAFGEPLPSLKSRQSFAASVKKGAWAAVSRVPVSGYAEKKPEEAFCEALGLLVAYGPRAVDPEVRAWLQVVAPSVGTRANPT